VVLLRRNGGVTMVSPKITVLLSMCYSAMRDAPVVFEVHHMRESNL
jgi:hypothetical protein